MKSAASARWLDLIPGVVATWIVWRVLGAFVARVDHPFDLEWMEGGMLAHAWRLQEGLGLYVAPNPDFIPYIYPPGYPALLAGAGAVFGLDYPVGRVLSIVGTLAAAAAIPFVTQRQLKHWIPGALGAALYLGLFRASGGFYDLVRPDALGIGLVAWSVSLALERWRGAEVASGLLLCAAFVFKHNLALFGLPLLTGIALRDGWPAARRFVAASAGPALLITGLVQALSGGHYLTYLLRVPRSHPMLWERLVQGLPGELGVWLLGAAVAAPLWIVARGQPGRRIWEWGLLAAPAAAGGGWLLTRDPIRGMDMGEPWVSAVVGAAMLAGLGATIGWAARGGLERAIPTSWRVVLGVGVGAVALLLAGLMRAHHGGFINVLMPAHWVLSLALPVVVIELRERLGAVAIGLTSLAMLAQLGWVGHKLELASVIPDDADLTAGQAVEQALADACPTGLIFAPQFAWLPTRVGRPPSLPLIALWDVADHPTGPYYQESHAMMRRAIQSHHWSCVLQATKRGGVWPALDRAYRVDTRLRAPASELRPKTGWRVRPGEILVPREP